MSEIKGPPAAMVGPAGAPERFVRLRRYPCQERAREREATMPAKSKAQQQAAGAALSAKRGERKVSSLKGASKSMYSSMSKRQLDDLASGDRKGKPKHESKKS